MRKPHRADFIKASVIAALIGAGAVVCIVLITYTDLNRDSSLIGRSLLPVKGAKKQVNFVGFPP
jgi:preprotein translocase subunit SecD